MGFIFVSIFLTNQVLFLFLFLFFTFWMVLFLFLFLFLFFTFWMVLFLFLLFLLISSFIIVRVHDFYTFLFAVNLIKFSLGLTV